jgi:hypothetical protein
MSRRGLFACREARSTSGYRRERVLCRLTEMSKMVLRLQTGRGEVHPTTPHAGEGGWIPSGKFCSRGRGPPPPSMSNNEIYSCRVLGFCRRTCGLLVGPVRMVLSEVILPPEKSPKESRCTRARCVTGCTSFASTPGSGEAMIRKNAESGRNECHSLTGIDERSIAAFQRPGAGVGPRLAGAGYWRGFFPEPPHFSS